MWKIIDTGTATAEANMAFDAQLLKNLPETKQRILHLYDWDKPSITHGYFLNPSKFLNISALEKHEISLAKRPTGGGIVFHFSDLAFSILIPASDPDYSANTLANYSYINGLIKRLLETVLGLPKPLELFEICCEEESLFPHCCMAHPVKYDLMYEGKKVAGGAQRRTKHGFLHQGTIHLEPINGKLLQDIVLDSTLTEKIEQTSFVGDKNRSEILQKFQEIGRFV